MSGGEEEGRGRLREERDRRAGAGPAGVVEETVGPSRGGLGLRRLERDKVFEEEGSGADTVRTGSRALIPGVS